MRFEFAQDRNGDGQITDAEDGGWRLMTPAGLPTGNNVQENPALGVQSWGEAAADSEPQFGARPANKGWMTFGWDALYDLGCPPSTAAYEIRNVWLRVTAIDANVGFPTLFRNLPGNDQIVIVRDRDALWLQSFAPRGGNLSTVKVNEPIDFVFNGHLDPASVGPQTLRIYRNSTQVLGAYQVTQGATPCLQENQGTLSVAGALQHLLSSR